MRSKLRKGLSLVLTLSLLFQQIGFAQIATELNIASHLSRMASSLSVDKFRPLHLRYFSYSPNSDNFKFLFDKGDAFTSSGHFPSELSGNAQKESVPGSDAKFKEQSAELLKYFLIGITLPDSKFWVNLRPDSENQIIEQELEQTDLGRVLLEADLQLKKDTARYTSPETPEGKEYWNRLYKKAEELFGYENITIPTLTRPWIVPGEIIVRETQDSAFIYKSTLKVMLESDYLKTSTTRHPESQATTRHPESQATTRHPEPQRGEGSNLLDSSAASRLQNDYSFNDPRLKALNEYSTQLIKELIIPKLTKEVNTSKKYANLRQVFYSLILSRWFKARYASKKGLSPKGAVPFYVNLINSGNLNGLTSTESWSKTTYFKEYQKSFTDGEYNLKEQVYTPTGQVIRSYFSGGFAMTDPATVYNGVGAKAIGDENLRNPNFIKTVVSLAEDTVLPKIDIVKQESDRDNKEFINSSPLEKIGTTDPLKFKEVCEQLKSRNIPLVYLYKKGLHHLETRFDSITRIDNVGVRGEKLERPINKRPYWDEGFTVYFSELSFIGSEDAATEYLETLRKNPEAAGSPVMSKVTFENVSSGTKQYSGEITPILPFTRDDFVKNLKSMIVRALDTEFTHIQPEADGRLSIIRKPIGKIYDRSGEKAEVYISFPEGITPNGTSIGFVFYEELIGGERMPELTKSVARVDIIVQGKLPSPAGSPLKDSKQASSSLRVPESTGLSVEIGKIEPVSSPLEDNSAVVKRIKEDKELLVAFDGIRDQYNRWIEIRDSFRMYLMSFKIYPILENYGGILRPYLQGVFEDQIPEDIEKNLTKLEGAIQKTISSLKNYSDDNAEYLDNHFKDMINAWQALLQDLTKIINESKSNPRKNPAAGSPIKTNRRGQDGSFQDSNGVWHYGEKGFVDSRGITHIGEDGFVDSQGITHAGEKGYVDEHGVTHYGTYGPDKDSEGSSPMQAQENKAPVGGIDFRVMNIVTQPLVTSSSLNLKLPQSANLVKINLDEEFKQLQNMVSAGITPSGERIKEFMASSALKGEWDKRIPDIISCLVDVCRLEEDNVSDTPLAIREALIIADSVNIGG